jgi:hypothetical protein
MCWVGLHVSSVAVLFVMSVVLLRRGAAVTACRARRLHFCIYVAAEQDAQKRGYVGTVYTF